MDLEQCKQKAVAMLRDYRNNEVCIQMLQGDLLALQQLHNYNRNMAVSYDQPGSSRTNKVLSPVETELVILEQQRELLQAEQLQQEANIVQVINDCNNMLNQVTQYRDVSREEVLHGFKG